MYKLDGWQQGWIKCKTML